MFTDTYIYSLYKGDYLNKPRELLKQKLEYYTEKRKKLQMELDINGEKMSYIDKYLNSYYARECLWKIRVIEELLSEYACKYKLGSVL